MKLKKVAGILGVSMLACGAGTPATARAGAWSFGPVSEMADVITATPTTLQSAPGVAREITVTYKDAVTGEGYSSVLLLVNKDLGDGGFAAKFERRKNYSDTGSSTADKLYLSDGFGTGTSGGFAPGSNNIITTANGKLDCSKTTVTRSGNDLIIKWNFIPNYNQSGLKKIYGLNAYGETRNWIQLGTWTLDQVPAGAPVIVSVAPANGTTAPGTPRTFTAVYRDENGVADIKDARIVINSSPTYAGGLVARYANNRFSLANDDGVTFSQEVFPGSNMVLSNSQGSLDISKTTVSAVDRTLTIKWAFTPKHEFRNAKTIYGWAKDAGGLESGLTPVGSWTIERGASSAPVNVSVTPNRVGIVTGGVAYLTTTQRDLNGADDIIDARLAINGVLSGANGFIARYNGGKLYLANDAGTSFLGGFAPGSANTISNSQGSLDCSKTTVTLSANNLIIKWAFKPSATFKGTKNVYLQSTDRDNLVDGWDLLGTVVTDAHRPTTVSVTPATSTSNVGVARDFTIRYRDLDGANDIVDARILINNGLTGNSALGARYLNGKLYIISGSEVTGEVYFSGGFAPGSPQILTSVQGKLDCSKTTVTKDGNDLVIKWNITPNAPFARAFNPAGKKIYGWAYDSTALESGWSELGTWHIPNPDAIKAPSIQSTSAQAPSTNRG